MPGDWWTSSLARLSTLEHKQMDDFFISGASRVDGPQHAQTLSVDLPIASVFFPVSSGQDLCSGVTQKGGQGGSPPRFFLDFQA